MSNRQGGGQKNYVNEKKMAKNISLNDPVHRKNLSQIQRDVMHWRVGGIPRERDWWCLPGKWKIHLNNSTDFAFLSLHTNMKLRVLEEVVDK